MATYAIGDLQGCYDPFIRLLDAIQFDPDVDTLWLTGDLVNRGPKSLKTLRYVKSLGGSVITVLGNHDLHLLALATDAVHFSKRFATLERTLNAPDLEELVDWLRHRPLAHYHKQWDTLLVHAGIYPAWSVKKALRRAGEVESALQDDGYVELLSRMYGNTPRAWSGKLSGYQRLRFIINAFTRMRMLTSKMNLNFAHAGSPYRARSNLKPWFDFEGHSHGDTRIIFGHWSQLGLVVLPELLCLDTGCVWGRQLTAVRLDTEVPRVVQVHGQEQIS
jgi:bis(5'-nucleosyl)-tetraphosphatase (symmetrical)